MTAHDKLILAVVEQEVKGLSKQQAIELLFAKGLLSTMICERIAIRRDFEKHVSNGVPRCRAIEESSVTFCCSYEKVRGIIYNNLKY